MCIIYARDIQTLREVKIDKEARNVDEEENTGGGYNDAAVGKKGGRRGKDVRKRGCK